jgi:hypothetical protein
MMEFVPQLRVIKGVITQIYLKIVTNVDNKLKIDGLNINVRIE